MLAAALWFWWPPAAQAQLPLGIVLSPTTLAPAEGGTAAYTVKLSSQPTAQVTVAITGTAETDLSLDKRILTFTTSNWGTAQTVTVSAAQDADATDDTSTLTHTAAGGDYASLTAYLPVEVDDDDLASVGMHPPYHVSVDEGSTARYSVWLVDPPTAPVTINIASEDTSVATVAPDKLTFATDEWGFNNRKFVTVTGVENDIDERPPLVADFIRTRITHTATGGNYAGSTWSLPVAKDENDLRGFTYWILGRDNNVVENSAIGYFEGTTGLYLVSLKTEPRADTQVEFASSNTNLVTVIPSPRQVCIPGPCAAGILKFTPENWSAAQAVWFTVADNAVDEQSNRFARAQPRLTPTFSGQGSDYDGYPGHWFTVNVFDNDTGVTVTPTSLTLTEGEAGSYTVKPDSQPYEDLVLSLTTTGDSDAVTVTPSSLTFTETSWQTSQRVTVNGNSFGAATISHGSSGDNKVPAVNVAVTVKQMAPTVSLSAAASPVDEGSSVMVFEGDSANYMVKLSSQPTAPVTVTITGTSGTDLSLTASSLTFTTSTWNTLQTVTVSAAQDDDAVDDMATLTHTATGGDYAAATADLPVTVDDDESVGIVLSETSLNPSEGGSAAYTVKLSSQPTAQVTVAIAGTSGTDLGLSTSSLTFTTSNWGTAQTVTVSAAQDDDATDDEATLTHTAAGGDYADATADLPVTVDDDESVGIVLSPTTLAPAEGSSANYTVKLSSEPTAQVTVAITGTSGTDLLLTASSLTFTTSTWNTAQTVTVWAAQDDDATDDEATLTHTATGGDYAAATADLPVKVDDDESLGIVLSPTTLAPAEGSSANYTVALSSEPTAQVTVAITGDADTDLSLSTSSLTFTTSDWGTAQTVTVSAAQDDDAVDDEATLTHTAAGGDYADATADLPVKVDDDESLGIVLSPTTLAPAEGSSANYTVALSSEPTAQVTVAITGDADTDLSLSTSSLTFTTSDWGTAQTVTVSAAQDDDAVDDEATLTHTAAGGDYADATADLPVKVDDDESLGIVLSPTTLAPAEGSSANYTVALSSEPTAQVTVAITGDADTDLSLSTSSLTFTTSDWGTAQTVTVSAAQDDDAVDDEATLTHTAAGGDYADATADLPVKVDDDESLGIVLSPTTLTPAEGSSANYTVKLSSVPTAQVTVAITGDADTDLSLSTSSLTFTTSTWSTLQTVTVSAAQDGDAVNDEATLTHTATGGDYATLTAELPVTVDDDESAGIVLSPTTLTPAEGSSANYTVKLSSVPTAQVTVAITGDADTDLSLSTSSLTFTTSTWSTLQTVTVSAAQDGDAVNDEATLTHTATGGDYATLTAELPVTVDDDESAGIVLSPTTLTPAEGSSANYTVKLSSVPTAQVTVAITGDADTDLSLSTSSLTFTTSTWSTLQTVTVSAAQDGDAVNDEATLTHTATGGDYATLTAELPVTVDDDESAGIVLSPTTLTPAEGSSANYTVKLSSVPTAQVTVAITGASGTDLSLTASSLTFTTSTWNTLQTVTVSAAQDGDAVNDEATLTHTATGGDYATLTAELPVTVDDDESAGIVLSPTTLAPAEGSSANYTVALSSVPTAQVTVAITGDADTDLSLSTSSLTFTTSTWSTLQTVTVSAAQDGDAVNDEATLTHTATGGDYATLTAELPVTVDDDESAGIVLSPTTLTPAEGSSANYTVKLSSVPTAQVTVAITGASGTDLSLTASSLTFTTSTWSTLQTVTVSAAQDGDAVNDEATLTHTATGGDYATLTAELPVTVDDDESAGIVLSPTTLTPAEGSSANYTVKLSSVPTAQVTVAITGASGTDLSLTASSLTFTTSTWNTLQTVTVSAAQDGDAVNDEATLTHTATGGNYATLTAELPVTVDDDESAGIVLSPTTLTPAEGSSANYTVKLSSVPTAQVTVAIAGISGTDLSLSTSSLTFTTSTWSTLQTVTVSAAQDGDAVNDEATLTHTATGGDYATLTAELPVTVDDDESAGIVLSPTTLTPTEGGNAAYTVKLSSVPTAQVTVAITGASGTDLSLTASSLTFTTSTWNTLQTVTVSAAQDGDAVDDEATLTHTATGGDYATLTAELPVRVDDDESAGIVLSKTALTPAEGGNESYTVKLSSVPTAQVTVAITGASGTDLSLTASSLTFTTSTWSALQTVTVSAAQDDDATDDEATLTHTATGGDYATLTAELPVRVDDDESAGIVLSKTALTPAEGGNESYTVKLSSVPTAQVTVAITGASGTDLSLTVSSLTFTTSTWNTLQTVTVSAAQDGDAVNDEATLTHTATGGDYATLTAELPVTVDDDESAGIVLSPTTLTPAEGGNAAYTVKLSSVPTAQVTVAITGASGTDLSLTASSLTFTTSTWSTLQTVTVSAAQDGDAVDDEATLTHTATGGDYATLTAELPVTVDDDESAGIVLSPTTLAPAEGGNANYTVKLSSVPTAQVTVAITGTSGTDLSLTASSLTFTTSTWNTLQTVTVSAAQDGDAVNDEATLTHTATGGDYATLTADLPVRVDDDESAGIVLSPTTLAPTEGSSAAYTVKLSSVPTAQVTVAITGASGTDLSLTASSLTFTTSTWSALQTVTVSAAQDGDAVDDEATLTHTATGGDYATLTAELPVRVDDDESAGIVLSKTALTPAEGGNESYTVKLSSVPTAQVTVAITGASGTDLSLTASSLTFTTSTWNTLQTVTVSAAQDGDAVDDEATLTHTATGGDYATLTAELPVTVDDDESAGIVLSPTTLAPTEGGNAAYTVKLSSVPTAQVTVAITGTSGTDLSLTASSLTFTTSTWNTLQTVTVSAAQDGDAVNDEATLTHTATGGDYATLTAELPVTVDDDESAGIVLSPTTLTPAEGGNAAYTVKLSSVPTAQVTVAITGASGTDLSLTASSLTFTTSTWSALQTVTVSAAQDGDAVDDEATLTHTATGGDYATLTAELPVRVDDDESAGIVLSPTTLAPTEGSSAAYTVKLSSVPTAQVTVAITGASGTDLSLTASSLTFTTSTWNTLQTVTVSAAQDGDAVNDEATLTHTATGGDYATLTAELPVTVDDDESAGIVLSPTTLTPAEGGNANYTVKLSSVPTAQVTVAITGTSGTDLSLTASSLTFTTSTWSTLQTVTVSAAQDGDAVNDEATLTHTATGGDYATLTAELPVTVDDDESAGIVLSPTTLTPAEGGNTNYTVKLSSVPTAQVTVAITGTSGTDLSLTTSSLTFTTSGWNTAQTVTVSAAQDGDAVDDEATLTHTATGGNYGSLMVELPVTVVDDESAGIVLSPSSLELAEGEDETYTVKLSSQPTAQVTVAITGTANTDLTLDTTSLTFTTSTWDTAQTVTVEVAEDADADNDMAALLHTASGGDYASVTAELAVTVLDDEIVVETAGIVLSPSSLELAEGEDAPYTVRLATEPTAQVTVAITGTSTTDLTLDMTSLTFTTSTWNTGQTVTVEAAEDADADNDTATLLHTASGGDYASVTAELAVTVLDDDGDPVSDDVVLSVSPSSVSEGGRHDGGDGDGDAQCGCAQRSDDRDGDRGRERGRMGGLSSRVRDRDPGGRCRRRRGVRPDAGRRRRRRAGPAGGGHGRDGGGASGAGHVGDHPGRRRVEPVAGIRRLHVRPAGEHAGARNAGDGCGARRRRRPSGLRALSGRRRPFHGVARRRGDLHRRRRGLRVGSVAVRPPGDSQRRPVPGGGASHRPGDRPARVAAGRGRPGGDARGRAAGDRRAVERHGPGRRPAAGGVGDGARARDDGGGLGRRALHAGVELVRRGPVQLHGDGPGRAVVDGDGAGDGDACERPAGGGRRRGGDAGGRGGGGGRAGQRHGCGRRPAACGVGGAGGARDDGSGVGRRPVCVGVELVRDGPLQLHHRGSGRSDVDGDGDDDGAAGERRAGGGGGHPGPDAGRGRRGGDGGPDAVLHRRGRGRAQLRGGLVGHVGGDGGGRGRDADAVAGGHGDGNGDGDGGRPGGADRDADVRGVGGRRAGAGGADRLAGGAGAGAPVERTGRRRPATGAGRPRDAADDRGAVADARCLAADERGRTGWTGASVPSGGPDGHAAAPPLVAGPAGHVRRPAVRGVGPDGRRLRRRRDRPAARDRRAAVVRRAGRGRDARYGCWPLAGLGAGRPAVVPVGAGRCGRLRGRPDDGLGRRGRAVARASAGRGGGEPQRRRQRLAARRFERPAGDGADGAAPVRAHRRPGHGGMGAGGRGSGDGGQRAGAERPARDEPAGPAARAAGGPPPAGRGGRGRRAGAAGRGVVGAVAHRQRRADGRRAEGGGTAVPDGRRGDAADGRPRRHAVRAVRGGQHAPRRRGRPDGPGPGGGRRGARRRRAGAGRGAGAQAPAAHGGGLRGARLQHDGDGGRAALRAGTDGVGASALGGAGLRGRVAVAGPRPELHGGAEPERRRGRRANRLRLALAGRAPADAAGRLRPDAQLPPRADGRPPRCARRPQRRPVRAGRGRVHRRTLRPARRGRPPRRTLRHRQPRRARAARATGGMMGEAVSILVPTLREAENIPALAAGVRAALSDRDVEWEMVLVDDDSQDGSDALVAEIARRLPVRLETRRAAPRDLALSVLLGMRRVRFDRIVVMDADLSHPPERIVDLLAALGEDCDIVVGSRYLPGASVDRAWGRHRAFASWLGTLLARPLADCRDPLSGFFATDRRRLPDLESLRPVGYKIALELMARGRLRVREVPIRFVDRRRGRSNLSWRTYLAFLRHLCRLYHHRLVETLRRRRRARACGSEGSG